MMEEPTVPRRYYEEKIGEAKDVAYKRGIREVVEWLNEYFMGEPWMTEDDPEWVAKLKEWGLE